MNKKLSLTIVIAAFLFLLSSSANAETFFAYLNSAQEVPTNASSATGYARVFLNEAGGTITFTVVFNGLSSTQTASHIHAPAAIGVNAAVAINFGAVGGTSGTVTGTVAITPTQIAQLRAHQGYVNVHTTNFAGGEIRGQLGVKRSVDFDGDGRQDYSVWRFPAAGTPKPIVAWNLNSTSGQQTSPVWGDADRDFPAPGDFDGDGKDDQSLFRGGVGGSPAEFWILKSSGAPYPNNIQYYNWGVAGDASAARDYDGDGKTDIAVFRPGNTSVPGSTCNWIILRSSTSTVQNTTFGLSGDGTNNFDTPVPGDYDGDGKFDIAVYRFALAPANTYIVLRSSDAAVTWTQWGNFNTDYALPGDYDGDGKFDYCAARTGASSSSPMVWQILQSSNGAARYQTFGISSDLPTQGDYDGDARNDIAVYRRGPTTGSPSTFWVLNSLNNNATATNWGVREDFPIANFDAR